MINDLNKPLANIKSSESVITNTFKRQAQHRAQLAGRYDASELFKYLIERVEGYQKGLDDDEEIGLKLANFGIASEIHIRTISYQNPNLIEFTGVDSSNNEVTLIQHISQLNFLLVALKPVKKEAYRIGFT